jgi:hypothetical protein
LKQGKFNEQKHTFFILLIKVKKILKNNYKTLCFFPIRQNASKGAKKRQSVPFGAMRAPFSAMKSPFCAFLRLLTPFCAFSRTFAVLGQAEIFRCIFNRLYFIF